MILCYIQAQDLLMEELSKFRSWQFSLGAIPAIAKLQEKAEQMRLEEMKKATKKLNNLNDKELETVERLTKGTCVSVCVYVFGKGKSDFSYYFRL